MKNRINLKLHIFILIMLSLLITIETSIVVRAEENSPVGCEEGHREEWDSSFYYELEGNGPDGKQDGTIWT